MQKIALPCRAYLAIGLLGAITLVLLIICVPFVNRFSDPEFQKIFSEWASSSGWQGVAAMLALQIIQTVIAPIPGVPVQIMAGLLYGVWGGLLLLEVGCLIGSWMCFVLTRRFGKRLVNVFVGPKKMERFDRVKNSGRLETAAFILYLLPGLPKDFFGYFLGLTRIGLGPFLFLSCLGRAAGMLSTTLIGSTFQQGDWAVSLAIFVVVGILGLLSAAHYQKVIDWAHGLLGNLLGKFGSGRPGK